MPARPESHTEGSSITRRSLLGAAGAAGLSLAGKAAAGTNADHSPALPALPLSILIRDRWPEEQLKRIREISPDITLLDSDDITRADVLFGMIGSDELQKATKLKWVQFPAAGVEGILSPAFVESHIVLTNAKGCFGPEIAEHVLGLLLALTRGIGAQARQMETSHEFSYMGPRPLELTGMTMGIIGLGGIGREVARRAKAMGMTVIAVDAEPMTVQQVCGVVDEVRLVDDGLDELIKRSNVLISAVPLTSRSTGMLGEAEFSRLPDDAYFINVSRGKVVKTGALIDAIKSKKLAGVALDVTDPEPLPKDHVLWAFPNVVITSHIAGRSRQGTQRVRNVFTENVRRCAAGLPLLNLVDKQKGY